MKNVALLIFALFGIVGQMQCRRSEKIDLETQSARKYTCPMHPQIVQDKPGHCPICKMDLVEKSGAEGAIMLTPSQVKLGNIQTTRVRNNDLGNATLLTGMVIVNGDQRQVFSSRVRGRIEKLFFKEVGQQILQGQPIYEIYSEELIVLQHEYLLARQQNEMASNNDGQYRDLLLAAEKKLILYGLTKRQIETIAATKRAEVPTLFLSPASGLISTINVEEGQYVDLGQTLYKVENIEKLWVEASLYSNDTHAVYEGDSVGVVIAGFEDAPVTGKVIFLNPEFNNNTQILPVRISIDNPRHVFLPGMRARISIVKTENSVISLPREAIIHDGDDNYVWILHADGSYSSRRVLTGLENDERVEIRYGLEENEQVVISGAYLLYSELALKQGQNLAQARE